MMTPDIRQDNENIKLTTPGSTIDLELAFKKYHELTALYINAPENRKKQIDEQRNKQAELIHEFVDQQGTYDPLIFQKNIAYLAKSFNLKVADVEECLNLSTGYISKMFNANSNKRMSLDQAWKISCLFDTDLNTLLTTDIQKQRGNTALVLRFIKKLTKMTRDAEIEWENLSGYYRTFLIDDDDFLITSGMLKRINEEEFHYMVDSDEEGYELEGDIMCLRRFISPTEDLYLVPYHQPWTNEDDTSYDFLAVKNENFQPAEYETHWRKIFDFIEALDNTVDKAAGKLYSTISDMYFDAKISPDDKAFIENFLKD